MNELSPSPKPFSSRLTDTVELVKRLCLAAANSEAYSIRHPAGRRAIEEAYGYLAPMLARRPDPIVLSVSEQRIILEGIPLEDRNPLVGRLGARLAEYPVHHLLLKPGVTREEFTAFFDILSRGPRHVSEQGGLQALLAKENVPHVELRAVSYVVLGEDEKVVSRSAVVSDGGAEAASTGDRILVGYLVAAGMTDKGAEAQGDREDLERSIIALEHEIRMRASKLMSSRSAQGLLSRILAVVTSHADQVRANWIAEEFLRGESTLRQTEKLLRDMAPGDQSPEVFLGRVRDPLAKRGMGDDALAKLTVAATPKAKKPRKQRLPSPALSASVSRRLKGLPLDETLQREITDRVGTLVEERARERTEALREEAGRLRAALDARESALGRLPWGVILWDDAGAVVYSNPAALGILKVETAIPLNPELQALLPAWRFPLSSVPETLPPSLDDAEVRRLMSCSHLVEGPGGGGRGAASIPRGVILLPGR
jgi:PAS domain-containing protein